MAKAVRAEEGEPQIFETGLLPVDLSKFTFPVRIPAVINGIALDRHDLARCWIGFGEFANRCERFRFGGEPYDFIFCRNLLIYFYTGAQNQALESLRQLLTADGLLFVGPAEMWCLILRCFWILCRSAILPESRNGDPE
jgi:hypothetical protein